ncbi:unnamed protein product [Bathycoccus prasinos]
MGKKMSGAQKRKKKKEKEAAVKEAVKDMERLKLGPTKLWTGLVLHHKDVFVSHVIPKLNETDRTFFSKVNGNLEMLKYCISNHCPCDEEASCKHAAIEGHLDCLRFLFDKVEPSRKTEVEAAGQATGAGHVEILKYIVEERKISDLAKFACAGNAAWNGQLDCLKYLVEEAKVPLDNTRYVSFARYKEHHDCLNYVREKGCPELTDEEYAKFAISQRVKEYIGHH